ncbi:TMEM175 family protein [Streptomyces sp. NBC_01497]|uniref:TMEM175 family protein n=1 Tax=Streptomyces sp. NBC_01497 TaxID=2903885 RepID=UPI002E335491|nr:TMEM175 family protein [Streptomyces sp. NBC_01497]
MSDSAVDDQTPDRLITLSDGIFAIAMTLLVLDIRVPPGLDTTEFGSYLHKVLPQFGAYALSFTILAGFWRDQRQILRLALRFDALTLRLALAGLGAIALIPFPTTLLSQYASRPLAVVIYASTVVLVDLLQVAVFLSLWRRPRLSRPISDRAARTILLDRGLSIVVFGATLPIAFVSPRSALWCWLALLPIGHLLARRERKEAAAERR